MSYTSSVDHTEFNDVLLAAHMVLRTLNVLYFCSFIKEQTFCFDDLSALSNLRKFSDPFRVESPGDNFEAISRTLWERKKSFYSASGLSPYAWSVARRARKLRKFRRNPFQKVLYLLIKAFFFSKYNMPST